jgi:hypothetical protein
MVLACLFDAPASAQIKDPVAVVHQGKDFIGSRLAYAVREKIRTSIEYRLVTEAAGSRFEIKILSVGITDHQSAVNVAYTAEGDESIFLTTWVYVIGSDRISDCADGILARLDEVLTQ